MEKIKTAIIGGGASGLICAAHLQTKNKRIVLFEKLDRVGKKLSATGNGQGNVSNRGVTDTPYFSFDERGAEFARRILQKYDSQSLVDFLRSLGGLCLTDERGRVYPASRQASSLTDLLRREVSARGVDVRLSSVVQGIEKREQGFLLTVLSAGEEKKYWAENVLLCAGGKAAKNFGTDGGGYRLAGGLGHTLTPLYPSLVQLKTDTRWTKSLKGIRAQDCVVRVYVKQEEILSLQGDVIFTEYGVSGDAIFRLSAYIADKIERGEVCLVLDLAPTVTEPDLRAFLEEKKDKYGKEELLCGVVNNQIGRAILRRAEEEKQAVSLVVKRFALPVTGSLGFDYAQVTKGGIPLAEIEPTLQSKKAKGLYFAGEILDVDGPCGGFNLQWAYASARIVADELNQK
ncbi:MAG: aminoacetone oxidase family FAD-binding enzyme [Clostridia bacterium]|nr:aminoacetone oxidase family FAD-binding enzyme [Clostridia bacterium]